MHYNIQKGIRNYLKMVICLEVEVSASSNRYKSALRVGDKHRNFFFYNPDFHLLHGFELVNYCREILTC